MSDYPKYRLKKDTPEFKTGSMFTRRKYEYGDYDDDCLFADISPGVSPVPAFDISLIDNFDEWFEEIKESGWWKPKFNDKYYFLGGTIKVRVQGWLGDEFDEYRYSVGNVFKTKESAERYRDYLKAIATVRQDEGVLAPDDVRKTLARDGTVYTIGINSTMLSVEHFYNTSAGAIYFDTGYNAKTSCDKHQDEWRTIADYDWSRE